MSDSYNHLKFINFAYRSSIADTRMADSTFVDIEVALLEQIRIYKFGIYLNFY